MGEIDRRNVPWQGGVAAPVGDEGAVVAGLQRYRRPVGGMGAELPQHPLGTPQPAQTDLVLRQQRHRAVDPDGQHVVALLDRRMGGTVARPGAEAADTRQDRITGLGMGANLARQGEQGAGDVEDGRWVVPVYSSGLVVQPHH